MSRESDDEIRRQAAAYQLHQKAEAHPEELNDEDLKALDGDLTSRLAREGRLTHLGLGKPRKPGRRG